MSLIKSISFPVINLLDTAFLERITRPSLFIPYHHLVSDSPAPHIEPLYKFKNTRQFEDDLDYLLKNFKFITPSELLESVTKGIPLQQNSFLLTFDDGLRQAYEEAAPILLRKGVEAVFFIVPSFLDNNELFYDFKKGLILDKLSGHDPGRMIRLEICKVLLLPEKSLAELRIKIRAINFLNRDITDNIGQLLNLDFESFLKSSRPFMTGNQVTDLIRQGFKVGAHSMNHPFYSLITEISQVVETRTSISYITEKFNLDYKFFAFPHRDTGVRASFFNELEKNEIKTRPDLIFGNQTGKIEKYANVFHRFIGENPYIPLQHLIKAIQVYQLANKVLGRNHLCRS